MRQGSLNFPTCNLWFIWQCWPHHRQHNVNQVKRVQKQRSNPNVGYYEGTRLRDKENSRKIQPGRSILRRSFEMGISLLQVSSIRAWASCIISHSDTISPKQIRPTIKYCKLQRKCNNTVFIVQIVWILSNVSSKYVSPDNYVVPEDDALCVATRRTKERLRPLLILITF